MLKNTYFEEHLPKKSVDPLTVTKEKSDVDDSYLVQSFYSRKVAETINKKKIKRQKFRKILRKYQPNF